MKSDPGYNKDFKDLKPLPPEHIPYSSMKTSKNNQIQEMKEVRVTNIHQISNKTKEVNMVPLNNSKTLWGFGIAVFIYIMQSLLITFNITSPDNLILKTFIEVIIAVSGFFGVYGIRDALRKMTI